MGGLTWKESDFIYRGSGQPRHCQPVASNSTLNLTWRRGPNSAMQSVLKAMVVVTRGAVGRYFPFGEARHLLSGDGGLTEQPETCCISSNLLQISSPALLRNCAAFEVCHPHPRTARDPRGLSEALLGIGRPLVALGTKKYSSKSPTSHKSSCL